MQAFPNQQTPDIQALFSQFLAQLPPAQLEQLTTRKSDGFPDIRTESRTHVPTNIAAHWLGRRPQTLREWSMTNRHIIVHRVNGKLAWPVADIRKLLGVL